MGNMGGNNRMGNRTKVFKANSGDRETRAASRKD